MEQPHKFTPRKNERGRFVAEIVDVCFQVERVAQVWVYVTYWDEVPCASPYLLAIRCISVFYTSSASLSMSGPTRRTVLHASLYRTKDIVWLCNSGRPHFMYSCTTLLGVQADACCSFANVIVDVYEASFDFDFDNVRTISAGISYTCIPTNLAGDRFDHPGDKLYWRSFFR